MLPGPRWLHVVAVVAVALAAATAPVWTYALALALFGLPHVLVEFRYVDERFAARLPRRTLLVFGVGLLSIALVRTGTLADIGTTPTRVLGELLLGSALVAAALPLLLPRRPAVVAGVLLLALLLGAYQAPLTTLVVLALLHNLTPIGFLAERLRGRPRRRALLACALVFGALPLLLLTGAFESLLGPLSMSPMAAGPLGAGSLDANLPVFVPATLLGTPFADRLFAAAAYLQCMHYAVVLLVLPRLIGDDARPALPWPRRAIWRPAVVGLAALAAIGFGTDFAYTRSSYAVLAAIHAWLELPILSLACGLAAAPTSAPTSALAA